MGWRVSQRERVKKVLDGLAAGVPLMEVLKESGLTPGRARQLLASKVARRMMREERELHALQREMILRRGEGPASGLLAAEVRKPGASRQQVALARELVERVRGEGAGGSREEVVISEEEVRAACREEAEAFEREAAERFAS